MSGPFGSSQWMYNHSTGFYNGVATQSLRFDSASSAYLNETLGTPTTRRRWTLSMWVKRAKISYNYSVLFSTGNLICRFGSGDTLQLYDFDGNFDINLTTTQVFRDTSAWYHLVFIMDIDGESGNDRLKLYSNNVRVSWSGTDPANYDPRWNYASVHYIGRENTTSNYFDGYMAEVNFVDGSALLPTSFGETKNGVWIPIEYTSSYGNNGFRLQFNQTGTGTGSTTTVGADTSGNANHFSSSGIVASDCDMPDSPEVNFATLNSLSFLTDNQLENGNLELDHQTTTHRANTGTMFMQTGKWYFEVYNTNSAASPTVAIGVGLQDISKLLSYASGDDNYLFYSNNNNAKFYTDTSVITLGTGGTHVPTAGSIIQVAYDADTGNIFIGVNNTYIAEDGGSDGNPATGANPTKTLSTNIDYIPFVGVYNNIAIANFGQDSTFAGATTAGGNTDGNGIGDFKYSVPSGYLALCTANLPEPTISPNADTQADDHFTPILYVGNTTDGHLVPASGDTPDSISFAPDWIWIKNRDAAHVHVLIDSVRGVNAGYLTTINTNAESGNNSLVKTIETSSPFGFTLGTSGAVNGANNLVAWVWKAGGTAVSNTDGSITSSVSANTDSGFSIVTYTGTGATSATIGHGLNAVPKVLIVKNRSAAYNWKVYHQSIGNTKYLTLDTSDLANTATSHWNNTTPTSSVFTIGSSNALIRSGDNFVAYCFAEIEGFSSFGKYVGNNATSGTFVYTGFRPAWVLVKDADTSGYNWYLYDSKRDTDNVNSIYSIPNTNGVDLNYAGDGIDFLSNGFKLRTLAGGRGTNRGNINYIYMAFAENPFKYANAR